MFKKISPILIISVLSILVILPYFKIGFFPTHDGGWVPVRLAEMIRELKDFQFPARMSGFLNHGYGYPLFNFAYPMPYYLGTLIYSLGFGLVGATKILFALTVPLSGFFMYFLGKELWKSRLAGLVCATLYIFLPYRIIDLYVRGSIGESIGFVLFPAAIYFALKKHKILLAIIVALLITSHNIMAVLFLPILFLLSLLFRRNIIISVLLGLGLSAFFWVPALLEKNLISLSQIPIADRSLYFLNIRDLFIPKWGYGLPTNVDGFGYQLGWPQILTFVLATFLSLRKKLFLPVSLAGLSLVLAFLLFRQSNPIWQLPLLQEINYPWTLLASIGFLISLLAGVLVRTKLTSILGVILAMAAIIYVLPHAVPTSHNNYTDDYYRTNDATTTSSDELMPLWVKTKPTNRPERLAELIEGQGEIKTIKNSSREIIFQANLSENSKIKVNKIYYPGWTWTAPHGVSDGLMNLSIPKGNHKIIGNFQDTPLRQIANLLSVLSVLLTIGMQTGKLHKWRDSF